MDNENKSDDAEALDVRAGSVAIPRDLLIRLVEAAKANWSRKWGLYGKCDLTELLEADIDSALNLLSQNVASEPRPPGSNVKTT